MQFSYVIADWGPAILSFPSMVSQEATYSRWSLHKPGSLSDSLMTYVEYVV